MTNPDVPDDTPRDEHLRAALRHAPDAGLQPPPHLRAQIVAAAQRALTEPGRAAPAARPGWAWMTSPLGASGALASLMLAGVIGLMWQETPPGPALDEPLEARPSARSEAPEAQASATVPRRQVDMESARVPLPLPPTPAAPPAPPQPTPAAPAVAKVMPPRAPLTQPPETGAPAAPAAARAAAEVTAPEPQADALEPSSAAPPPPAVPAALPPAAPPAMVEPPARRPVPLAAAAPAMPPAPATALGSQALTNRAQSARTQGSAPESAPTQAAAMRWHIDGVERGAASPGWVQAAQRLDLRLGQPSEFLQLADARQIDLVEPSGAVIRLWLGETQLLWCPADSSACRLSTLVPATADSLLRLLPAAPAAPAADPPDQTPKRDSR